MSNPFTYVESILKTKKNLLRGTDDDAAAVDEYNPWLTNLALTYHEDTVLIANMANKISHVPKRAQYEALLGIVRARARPFKKWAKLETNETLDLVCEVYGCNRTVGRSYLTLLTDEQLDEMRSARATGGTK